MSVSESLADLTKKVADLYKELVTNSVRFEELRRLTVETLSEFKHAVERISDKVDNIQHDHVRSHSELKAEILILKGRLDTLSEQALHIAVKDVAREVAEAKIRSSQVSSQVIADRASPASCESLTSGEERPSNPGPQTDG